MWKIVQEGVKFLFEWGAEIAAQREEDQIAAAARAQQLVQLMKDSRDAWRKGIQERNTEFLKRAREQADAVAEESATQAGAAAPSSEG